MIRNITHCYFLCKKSSNKLFLCTEKFFMGNKPLIVDNFQRFHTDCIVHAKGKDIKKDKKKVVQINEVELGEVFDVQKLFNDIKQPVEVFKSDLAERTSLRSSQVAIGSIKIQFEGKNYTIQDLASIQLKNNKLYVLDFFSFPQTISTVKKTLLLSEINPQQEGTKIFIPIPKATKEHREALAKKAKIYFNKCKDSIRDIQNKYLKQLKNFEKLSEEKKFRVTDQINALGSKNTKEAEEIFKNKKEELLKSE